MEEIERSAASVEEAIEAALAELGISEQEARIEIVQEPRGGLFGLGQQPAVVRVRAAPNKPVISGDALEEQAETAAAFVRELVERMGLDAEVEAQGSGDVMYVDVWGADSDEDMGVLIGKRGHTLESIQELVRSSIHRQLGERCAVQVDVEDYRKRRRSRVAGMAREAGRKVRKTGRPEALEPMPAFERKVVHDAIAELGGLETASEGEGPSRHVVIRKAPR